MEYVISKLPFLFLFFFTRSLLLSSSGFQNAYFAELPCTFIKSKHKKKFLTDPAMVGTLQITTAVLKRSFFS
eukprot:c14882_g2_i1 orf=89-304(-)